MAELVSLKFKISETFLYAKLKSNFVQLCKFILMKFIKNSYELRSYVFCGDKGGRK